MASVKKITMREYNGTDYDTLYPKTVAAQIDDVYSKNETYSKSQLYTQSQLYTKTQALADATKTLYGLSSSAVPNDALVVLSRFLNGLGNDYMWAKIKTQSTSQYDTSTKTNYVISLNMTIMYSNSFHTEGWWFVLDNPTTITITSSNMTTIKGKYFALETDNRISTLRKADSNANIYSDGVNAHVSSYTQHSNPQTIVTVSNYGYVNSSNSNAYPPAVSDGYTYLPLGQLEAKANIATGSYTGTGTYNSNNPNSLTFDFIPKFVLVASVDTGSTYWTIFSPLLTQSIGVNSGYISTAYFYANTMFWYNTNDAGSQFNDNGVKYAYVAFG